MSLDIVLLSRLQFATAAIFHFLFVPLTLGLSVLVAWMETRYVRTGDEDYRRMARFWGKIFLTNFAIGVVTGLTLEFQFGTNWRFYAEYVGDIFGSLLAIEATVAFFLESTFLAIWAFGWNRVSPRVHLASIWLVALASTLSAFWILCANAWMQHPVGFVLRNGRAELDSFLAVVTQPVAWLMFGHTVAGAFLLAGFFVLGVSAWHLARGSHAGFFAKSFRMAATFTLVFSLVEVGLGHLSGMDISKYQPAKLAAMESFWNGSAQAPQTLFLFPDEKNERNFFEIGSMPPILSVLAYGHADAHVQGLKEFAKEDRPPVTLVFLAFRAMVGLGFLFPLLAIWAWWRRFVPESGRFLLWLLPWCIPLPYLAIQAGWIVTELGRQPWIVHGIMRTRDAVSPLQPSQVIVSLAAFVVVYSILGIVNFTLLARFAVRGPEPLDTARAAAGGNGYA